MRNAAGTLLILPLLLITGCAMMPKIVKVDGKIYGVKDWDAGKFYYVSYVYKGGSFKGAEKIFKAVADAAKSRGLNEPVIGRYPGPSDWEFGFIASKPYEESKIGDYPVSVMDIPKGTYGYLLVQGYPENIFFYWDTLKKAVRKDGYKVAGPIFEIYTDLLDDSIPKKKQKGEIRVRVEK